jgi:hypothetical protein
VIESGERTVIVTIVTARRIRELVAELESLSLGIAERDEHWR